MTYYSKYLKYKNKYLELKNMIGGAFSGNEVELDKLWKARNDTGKVFEVTYCGFKPFYSQYCWISGTSYGVGFFLYRFNNATNTTSSVMTGHVKNGKYALWHLNESDIMLPLDRCEKVCENLLYKTTISLPTTDSELKVLPTDTSFDWSHVQNSWIYQSGQKFFKTGLKQKK
jgi:hypothetical protein